MQMFLARVGPETQGLFQAGTQGPRHLLALSSPRSLEPVTYTWQNREEEGA